MPEGIQIEDLTQASCHPVSQLAPLAELKQFNEQQQSVCRNIVRYNRDK